MEQGVIIMGVMDYDWHFAYFFARKKVGIIDNKEIITSTTTQQTTKKLQLSTYTQPSSATSASLLF